jgi:hypothetical protein
MRPGKIAQALCLELGLANAISSKQISNYMQYHKKSGQMKTPSVSNKNNNLRPEFSDSCMYMMQTCCYVFS